MAAPPDVTPEYYQILLVRELRKTGLDVGELRVHRRSELPEPYGGFVLELTVSLVHGGRRSRVLFACYRQDVPLKPEIVTQLPGRAKAVHADVAVLVTTADLEIDAVAAAQQAAIVLLRVVDARTAYDASGWGAPGHYPPWLPAHALQLVDRDAHGAPRLRPLDAKSFEIPG